MRPVPPYAVLSQDGKRAVYARGTRLLVIDTATGQSRIEQLPHEATTLALTPDGGSLAAANYNVLSLFRLGDQLEQLGQTAIPAKPYRLVTAANGTTAAAFVYNDEEGVIALWRGPTLTPVLGAEGHSLGAVLPDFIGLDAVNERLLVWGQQGAGAFGGTGDAYLRLFDFSGQQLREVWTGAELTFAPNGFVLPLAGGAVGAYDREQISIFEPPTLGRAAATYAVRELEKVVSSPNGARIAWLWNTSVGSEITYFLASAQLNAPSDVHKLAFKQMGAFEQFAIADDGQITLLYGQEPNSLLVFRSDGDRLIQTTELDVSK